jgi:superfamily II DNA or RNA helicase
MNMILTSPSTILLPEDSEKVQKFLTYTDSSIKYQIKKLKDKWHWQRSDPDGFQARLDELKSQEKKCLIFRDASGRPQTYSGLWEDLQGKFGWKLDAPLPDSSAIAKSLIPWANVPKHKIRYYQDEAVEALFANASQGPCSAELPTGSGKSRIIEEVLHRNPVQSLVITPSANITSQLHTGLTHLFGGKYVGKYGDGKKDIGKLFTVCTAQALIRVAEESDAWNFFSKTKQFVWDESHTTPAETFEQVELGLLRNVPRRFHVSATQIRGDGSDILLRGIIGPTVYRKNFKELVDQGYLARPYFKIFHVPAYGMSASHDINKETRQQLYLNPNVNKLAAEFACKAVTLAQRPTVIILDEFHQFLALMKYINVPFEFVHGGSTSRKDKDGNETLQNILPKQYWESDTAGAIARFNAGQTNLLIGTSAIATGVDLPPCACVIYLQGGMSEVQIKQAIGRGTRVTDTKTDVIIVDFKVVGSPSMERHADVRIDIYNSMGDVQEITP